MLLWECKAGRGSSETPWLLMRVADPPLFMLPDEELEVATPVSAMAEREAWLRAVEEYSQNVSD